MNLDELDRLAQQATPGHTCAIRNSELCDACTFELACSPERIRALVAVIRAGNVVRKDPAWPRAWMNYDAALAELEKLP